MMSIDTLETLSVISFIISIVFLLVAVALFFFLKIPNTLGYLTGTNRQKGIAQLRKKSEAISDKTGSSNRTGMSTSGLSKTEKMPDESAAIDQMPREGQSADPTTVLSEVTTSSIAVEKTSMLAAENPVAKDACIEILSDITYLHTNEIIK